MANRNTFTFTKSKRTKKPLSRSNTLISKPVMVFNGQNFVPLHGQGFVFAPEERLIEPARPPTPPLPLEPTTDNQVRFLEA